VVAPGILSAEVLPTERRNAARPARRGEKKGCMACLLSWGVQRGREVVSFGAFSRAGAFWEDGELLSFEGKEPENLREDRLINPLR